MSQTFKILSIDGGGVRGLYSALLLERFEKCHGKIVDHFDMICGTSTGGLIALALASGIPITDIVAFYKNHSPEIFPSSNIFIRTSRTLKQVFVNAKYSNKRLEAILGKMFGEKVMNDSSVCLCIPAVNLTSYHGVVFKTGHDKSLTRDGTIKMKDVALATSAAPTYLPIVPVKGVSNRCVDGGVWANNPALIGIIEAQTHFVGQGKRYKDIHLLSIDNLAYEEGWNVWKPNSASLIMWNLQLIHLPMRCQEKAVEHILSIAYRNRLMNLTHYVRINDHKLTLAQEKVVKLDRADKQTIDEIVAISTSRAGAWCNRPEIVEFFKEKKGEWKFPLS